MAIQTANKQQSENLNVNLPASISFKLASNLGTSLVATSKRKHARIVIVFVV